MRCLCAPPALRSPSSPLAGPSPQTLHPPALIRAQSRRQVSPQANPQAHARSSDLHRASADSREPSATNPGKSKLTELPYQSDEEPFSVSLSDESFETYELDPPPYTIDVTKKELKQMYYDMVVTRYATPQASC